jgi:hypothetical protein
MVKRRAKPSEAKVKEFISGADKKEKVERTTISLPASLLKKAEILAFNNKHVNRHAILTHLGI